MSNQMLLLTDRSQRHLWIFVCSLLPPAHVPYEASHTHKDSASEDVRLRWSSDVRGRSDTFRARFPLGRWSKFGSMLPGRLLLTCVARFTHGAQPVFYAHYSLEWLS
jgi:hypothetical protein